MRGVGHLCGPLLCNLYLSQLSELMTQSPHALPKMGYEHLTQTLPRGPEYARKVAQAVHSAIVALKIMLEFSDRLKYRIALYSEDPNSIFTLDLYHDSLLGLNFTIAIVDF
jgi:hypothetical protein